MKSQIQLKMIFYKEYIKKNISIFDKKLLQFLINISIEGFFKKILSHIIDNKSGCNKKAIIFFTSIYVEVIKNALSDDQRSFIDNVISKDTENLPGISNWEMALNNINLKKISSLLGDIGIFDHGNIIDVHLRNKIAHGNYISNKSLKNISKYNKTERKKMVFNYEKIIINLYKFVQINIREECNIS